MLWFDVGIKRYTTLDGSEYDDVQLWFDVGIKRYTTFPCIRWKISCCGLMQESKDIQLEQPAVSRLQVVV